VESAVDRLEDSGGSEEDLEIRGGEVLE